METTAFTYAKIDEKTEQIDSPSTWDVSTCNEYISNNIDVKATGLYSVDTSRGYDKTDQPRFLKQGSFGIVIDVKNEEHKKKNKEYVLRLSNDKSAFDKQWEFSFLMNSIIKNRQSPFFLKMKTAFYCDSIPSLGGNWRLVMPSIAYTFMGKEYYEKIYSDSMSINTRLFYIVIERANLFNLQKMVLDWEKNPDDSVHSESPFKIKLFFELLQGLATLHQLGITHRDIKLANMVFSQKKTPEYNTFVIYDKNFRRRIYRIQQITEIPNVDMETFTDRSRPKGYIRPHFIDWDFSMQTLGTQIKYYNNRIQGTPTTLAPEILLLSSSGFNKTEHNLKPDVFSIGIVLSEILSGYTLITLLQKYGYKQKLIKQENIAYIIAAYVGMPNIPDLFYYQKFIVSFIDKLDSDNTQQKNQALQSQKIISDLFTSLLRINAMLAPMKKTYDLYDTMESTWGISSRLFKKGILFEFLENKVEDGDVSIDTFKMLKKMLKWNPVHRPTTASLLLTPIFDQYLVNKVHENDSIWILPVSKTKMAERRTEPEIFTIKENNTILYHDLEYKIDRNECYLPGCLNTAAKKHNREFCSTPCKTLYKELFSDTK